MSRLYFGKISKQYPQQFEKNFYAGGPKGNSWYGGMEVGDYVFPIYNSSVSKLWRVKRYNPEANEISPEGSIEFEVVKEFPSIPISTGFARYRHFQLDIMLLNRLTKRSEEHTSELQSRENLVCRLLLEKKKQKRHNRNILK